MAPLAEDWHFAASSPALSSRYFNVRPYFKTYRLGDVDYRGANAGDFAAINEIDVTLGLCRTDDAFYQSIVREKVG
jgi:monodechloroaminopyrrolnitrin synthase PrnB-like protein